MTQAVQTGAVHDLLRVAVEQIGHYGHEPGIGQLVGHLPVEVVQPAHMEGDYHGWVWPGARGQRRVHIHLAAANGQLVSKTWHG